MSSLNSIEISGNVKITNGSRVVSVGNNTVCKSLIRHLMIWTYSDYIFACANDQRYYKRLMLPASGFTILFGKSNTPTGVLMTDLVNKIQCDPTSKISTGWKAVNDEISLIVTGTWSSGILNGYLSGGDALYEVGILCPLLDSVYPGNVTPSFEELKQPIILTPPTGLLSRYVIDSPGIVPDINAPVVVQWEFRWRFV